MLDNTGMGKSREILSSTHHPEVPERREFVAPDHVGRELQYIQKSGPNFSQMQLGLGRNLGGGIRAKAELAL